MIKFIIPVIVGAIIGYITNWLAIKMLFRPHTEKRFLGFKIPFTPGLIPKERNRVAKSVGETVGNHLLSPEMIIDSLNNKEVANQIENWIEQGIQDLTSSNVKLKDCLISSIGDSFDKAVYRTERAVNGIIFRELQREEAQISIVNTASKMLLEENIVESKLYSAIKEKTKQFICNPEFSETVKNSLGKMLFETRRNLCEKDMALKDVLPSSVSNSMKVYIYNHKQELADFLRDILNDEKIHEKLKANIVTLIELNFGKLVTMFMNPENIAIKAIIAAINYLNKPENQDDVASVGVKLIDALLEKRVKELFNDLPEELEEGIIEEASQFITDFALREYNQNLIISAFEDKIRENEDVLRENIVHGISNLIREFIDSDELKNNVSKLIHEGINGLLDMKLSEILFFVDESGISSIKTAIMDVIGNFINKKAPYFTNLLNIPKIVEDRINSFEVEFAERLILDIARKELSAITWLGALLGGIMGIMSPILQLLTR